MTPDKAAERIEMVVANAYFYNKQRGNRKETALLSRLLDSISKERLLIREDIAIAATQADRDAEGKL